MHLTLQSNNNNISNNHPHFCMFHTCFSTCKYCIFALNSAERLLARSLTRSFTVFATAEFKWILHNKRLNNITILKFHSKIVERGKNFENSRFKHTHKNTVCLLADVWKPFKVRIERKLNRILSENLCRCEKKNFWTETNERRKKHNNIETIGSFKSRKNVQCEVEKKETIFR